MLTLSNGRKTKGRIKSSAEDFIVEEITRNGTVLELDRSYSSDALGLDVADKGKIAIFVLQKMNWNTSQALRAIAKKFRRGTKSTGFAGTKDRISKSTQLCSLFGANSEELKRIHIKDISINGAWQADSKIKLGDLLGNRFSVMIRDIEDMSTIEQNLANLNGRFPNYFGEQRFGLRNNNTEIGIDILKGEFKNAVLKFLTDTNNETSVEATEARKKLLEEQDFKAALQYFPQYLKYERRMIEYLSRFPNNFANSIRSLPRALSLMFVHSVEDYIFNKELEDRIIKNELTPKEGDPVCDINSSGFPNLSTTKAFDVNFDPRNLFAVGNIIGFDTKNLTEFEKKKLEELQINCESFKLKPIKELSCKGSFRVLFSPYKDASFSNTNQDSVVFRFSLPAGSYATVLLKEFFR